MTTERQCPMMGSLESSNHPEEIPSVRHYPQDTRSASDAVEMHNHGEGQDMPYNSNQASWPLHNYSTDPGKAIDSRESSTLDDEGVSTTLEEECTIASGPPSVILVPQCTSTSGHDCEASEVRNENGHLQDSSLSVSPLLVHTTRPVQAAQEESMQRTRKDKSSSSVWLSTTDEGDESSIRSMLARKKSFRNGGTRNYVTDLLTVFQATPLVYLDERNRPQPLSAINMDHERKVLSKTLKGSSIAISFEAATTNQLGAFLAKGEGRVLHFSCHGREDYLAVEDGWGAFHRLEVEPLKKWIALGGKRLQLVFVSACHSRSIGQAFVDAGVPHVVCCQDNDAIVSHAAVKFESVFYQALACGNSLQKSFNLAKGEILVWPGLPSQECMEESRKYCLLPEGQEADHDVPIFFTDDASISRLSSWAMPETLGSNATSVSSLSKKFPSVPEHFVGRNVDLYFLLQKLKSSRLVKVSGPQKIGKSSLVKACCQWISERRQDLDLDEILWVPFAQENSEDLFASWFEDTFEKAAQESCSIGFFREDCKGCARKISQYLRTQGKGALLVLETKFLSHHGVAKLALFVGELLKRTSNHVKDVKVIIINGEGDGDASIHTPNISVVESLVEVGQLKIEGTIELFARTCPHVANRTHPRIASPRKLVDHLMPTCWRPRLSKRDATIMESLGDGYPVQIQTIASHMSVEAYKRLIAIGDQKDVEISLESRAKLINRAHELLNNISSAHKVNNLKEAQRLRCEYDEIQYQLQQMPNLNSMEQELDHVKFEIRVASAEGDLFRASDLEKTRRRLQSRILAEKEAMDVLGILQTYEAYVQRFATRAHIDKKMKRLEDERRQMIDSNEFDKAKATKAELVDLEELKPLRPSLKALSSYVSELESRLLAAKSCESYDTAKVIHARLREVKMKLASEETAQKMLSIVEAQIVSIQPSPYLKDPPITAEPCSGNDMGKKPEMPTPSPFQVQGSKPSAEAQGTSFTAGVGASLGECDNQCSQMIATRRDSEITLASNGTYASDPEEASCGETQSSREDEEGTSRVPDVSPGSRIEGCDQEIANNQSTMSRGDTKESDTINVYIETVPASSELGHSPSPIDRLGGATPATDLNEEAITDRFKARPKRFSTIIPGHLTEILRNEAGDCKTIQEPYTATSTREILDVPGAFRIGTEDEESCMAVAPEMTVASAWNVVDDDIAVEQAVEQRLQERLESMPVVAAIEIATTDHDDGKSKVNRIKPRRCFHRAAKKIKSLLRFYFRRQRRLRQNATEDR